VNDVREEAGSHGQEEEVQEGQEKEEVTAAAVKGRQPLASEPLMIPGRPGSASRPLDTTDAPVRLTLLTEVDGSDE
jgi:hypothetical protein